MHCAWPADYHNLSLTHIQFNSLKVTPLINLAKVTRSRFRHSSTATRKRHKSFCSYSNIERRIVRDNVGPLKTTTGQIVTTDNDMANTLNTHFNLVFTHEQLNNIPQLPRYVGNTLDKFNFRLEDVR